jgi:hypothetical protein
MYRMSPERAYPNRKTSDANIDPYVCACVCVCVCVRVYLHHLSCDLDKLYQDPYNSSFYLMTDAGPVSETCPT